MLEGHHNPHEVLREAERVLMPEGRLVISGFNTASLWRLRQLFTSRKNAEPPWDARFIGLLRLRDWLRVLGFELDGGRFGCYAPPFRSRIWLDRFAFMEKAGAQLVADHRRDVRGARGEARRRHAPGHPGVAQGARAAPGAGADPAALAHQP